MSLGQERDLRWLLRGPARRIGITAHGTKGFKSGLGNYLRNVLRVWFESFPQHQYHIFCTKADQAAFTFTGHRAQVHYHCGGGWHDKALLDVAWHNLVLPWKLLQLRLDVLYVAVDRRLPLWSPRPVSATVHDLAAFGLTGKYAASRQWYNHRVLPLLIRRCRHLLAVSRYTVSDMQRFLGMDTRRVVVNYNGVDAARFAEVSPDRITAVRRRYGISKPYLVYPSRLEHPGKNHVHLIKAFGQLRRSGHEDLELVCIGSPWRQVEAIHAVIEEESVQDHVRITGFVDDDELAPLVAGGEALIFPSLYEGFGMPVLEGMAAGIPVAVSTASCLPEIVGEAALLFDPTKPEEIAACMRRLLDEPDLRRDLVAAGQRRLAQFGWRRCAELVLAASLSPLR